MTALAADSRGVGVEPVVPQGHVLFEPHRLTRQRHPPITLDDAVFERGNDFAQSLTQEFLRRPTVPSVSGIHLESNGVDGSALLVEQDLQSREALVD